jgi:hypothetical protein
MEPADVIGVPMPTEDGKFYRHAVPTWAYELSIERIQDKPAVLVLDELSTAPPAVQAPALRIVHERKVGEIPLGPAVRIVAMANPTDTSAGTFDLTAAMANRLCHIPWGMDVRYWTQAKRRGFPPPDIVTPPDGWKDRIGHWANLTSTFCEVRPECAQNEPKGDDERGRGWPSHRSWEMADTLLAVAEAFGEDVQAQLLTGAVGEATAHELLTWVRNLDLPQPEDVLADPTIVKEPPPGQDHRMYAILGGVLNIVRTRKGDEPTWIAACNVVAHICQFVPDLALPFAFDLQSTKPSTTVRPPEAIMEVFQRVGSQAGILAPSTLPSKG